MTIPENPVQRDPVVAAPQPAGTPPVTAASPPHPDPSLGSAAQAAGGSLREVAETAKDQTAHVAREAGDHAQELWHQTREELTQQAVAQQDRAARGLRSLGEELRAMSRSSEHDGMAADLARQGADLTSRVATWLEDREPGDIAGEVTRFARRRPGTFLLVAAAVGVVGGRLTRGLGTKDDASADVTDLRDRREDRRSQPGTDALMPPVGPVASGWSDTQSTAAGAAYSEPPMSAADVPGAEPRYAGGMP